MKIYLISNNTDTYIGMRMAGIEGTIVHDEAGVESALADAMKNPEIGLVLITAKLMDLCRQSIYEKKLNSHLPLIVEVPDRHGLGGVSDSITRYVREAVGIKI